CGCKENKTKQKPQRHKGHRDTSLCPLCLCGYLVFLIHARMGPETVLSGVSMANTSDIWLSPFRYNMVGQCASPNLHSSSCSAISDASMSPITPGSNSARASTIF